MKPRALGALLALTALLLAGCAKKAETRPVQVIESMPAQTEPAYRSSVYEFVSDPCAWDQARQRALDRGGRLVCFESAAELTAVTNTLEDHGKQDVHFRIGARRDEQGDYRWVDENDVPFGQALNAPDSWCQPFWLTGEPSFTYNGEDEPYVELYFDWGEGRWVLNDVRSVLNSPADPALIGYIVEYNAADPGQGQPPESAGTALPEAPETHAASETQAPVPADPSVYLPILDRIRSETNNGNARGFLYDLDGNGVQELMVLYIADAQTDNGYTVEHSICSIYTIENGSAKALIEREALRPQVAGGVDSLGVYRLDGQVVAGIHVNGADEDSYHHWRMLRLENGQLVPQLEVSAAYITSWEGNDGPAYDPEKSYFDPGTGKEPYEHYKTWVDSLDVLEQTNGYDFIHGEHESGLTLDQLAAQCGS